MKPRTFLLAAVAVSTALLVSACGGGATATVPITEGPRLSPIPEVLLNRADSATVRAHLRFLASDLLEGRGTGSRGEELAVAYIAAQFEEVGLQPAGDDGTFFQAVPLMGSTPAPGGPLVLRAADGRTVELGFGEEFIASTDLDQPSVSTAGDLVFVGYGIDAPGYSWSDFDGVDVRGKILVGFVNDPPATPAEPNLFQADTLTYFGRWTYKYEEARRRGAKGVLLIHTEQTAGYPFTVLSNGALGEQISLATPPENPLQMKGWLTRPAAERLAELAGTTVDDWFRLAASRDFSPQPLPVSASYSAGYRVRRFSGTNVVATLPGRTRPEEAVVYTAHHDHLGVRPGAAAGTDSVFNGAVDNASGVAMLITMAKAFAEAPPPQRSVIFASVTAEESGLLGASHYALHPAIPLAKTIANINIDSGNVYGRSRDIVGLGAERSELDSLFAAAAAAEGLTVSPDPRPNQGIFFRSDQLAFARGGVPAVFINTGSHFEGRPGDYFATVSGAYNRERYHQVDDEFDPAWPMGGIVQQMRVALRLGYRLADSSLRPRWNPGEAFARARGDTAVADTASTAPADTTR